MSGPNYIRSGRALVLLAAVCVAGCMSERQIMLETRGPHSTVISAQAILQGAELAEGESSFYGVVAGTGTQSVCVLRLGGIAVLQARHHREHDLTIVCVAGSAIVEIEEERSFVEAPACIVVPRLHNYKIVPLRGEADFMALLVYSPPFDGEDEALAGDESLP